MDEGGARDVVSLNRSINIFSTLRAGGAPNMTSALERNIIVSAIEKNVNGGVEVVGSPGRGSVSDWPSAAGAASMADASESDQAGLPPVEEVRVYE